MPCILGVNKMSRATPIPTKSRVSLRSRSAGRCERCGMGAAHVHHRRTRSIRDLHTHCLCNLVHLCSTCHVWAHAHPADARETGFIVSAYGWPGTTEFSRWDGAMVQPTCEGGVEFVEAAVT